MDRDESQERAVRLIVQVAGKKGISKITGGAGSGKSTIVRDLVDNIPGIQLMAPTNKAAGRLREITKAPVQTLSSVLELSARGSCEMRGIYEDIRATKNTSRFFPNEEARAPAGTRVILVDEAGMAPGRFLEMLLRYAGDVTIIAAGDPNQMRPVGCGVSLLDRIPGGLPLTGNHRQGPGCLALSVANNIRDGANIETELARLPTMPLCRDLLQKVDTVICYLHDTRDAITKYVRGGSLANLQPGEPLIVKDRVKWTEKTGKVLYAFEKADDIAFVRWVGDEVTFCDQKYDGGETGIAVVKAARVRDANGSRNTVLLTTDGHVTTNFEQKKLLQMEYKRREGIYALCLEAEFGYVRTVYSAQGSEYGKVGIVNEIGPGVDPRRYWYTAITRAMNECFIITEVEKAK